MSNKVEELSIRDSNDDEMKAVGLFCARKIVVIHEAESFQRTVVLNSF
jgi:hypothetical protein